MSLSAAIYVRKSTAQPGVPDDSKSVARQEESCRSFIASRSIDWTLGPTYTDDGVSGGTFEREGFQRMKAAAAAGCFQVLTIFDLDRFSRADELDTMLELRSLEDLGIEIWDSYTARQIQLEGLEGLMTHARSFAATQQREKVRRDTKAALRSRAKKGQPASRPPFGYKTIEVDDGSNKKRKAHVLDPTTAPVVLHIGELFASGIGYHTIARRLTSGTVRPPGGGAWSTQQVRFLLKHPYPRGRSVFGRREVLTRSEARRAGAKRKGKLFLRYTPQSEWIVVEKPELRIWPPELVRSIDARLAENARLTAAGHPPKAAPRNLLSGGLLVCPDCGSACVARERRYICGSRKQRPGSCPNRDSWPVAALDAAVLDALEDEVLEGRMREELRRILDAPATDPETLLLAERERLVARRSTLVSSLEEGVPAASIAGRLQELEAELQALDAKLAVPRAVPADPQALLRRFDEDRASWVDLLRGSPEVARPFLRRLIGPLSVWVGDDDAAPLGDEPIELVPIAHEGAELEAVRDAWWTCSVFPQALFSSDAPASASAGVEGSTRTGSSNKVSSPSYKVRGTFRLQRSA